MVVVWGTMSTTATTVHGSSSTYPASVNRHVLLQIHAAVTSVPNAVVIDTDKASVSWILTIDELEPPPQDRPYTTNNNLMTTTRKSTTTSSSVLPLDKELFLTWHASASSDDDVWQGTARTSLALPLQPSQDGTTTRTLILALWHIADNHQQRTLVARQVTTVPRSAAASHTVHLQGPAPALTSHTTKWSGWYPVLFAIAAVVLVLFVWYLLVSTKRQDDGMPHEDEYDYVSANEGEYDDEEEQQEEYSSDMEYEQEDAADNEYGHHPPENEYEEEEEQSSDHHHQAYEEEEHDEQNSHPPQDDPNDDWDDENEQSDDPEQQQNNPLQEFMLENLPAMPLRRNRQGGDEDASTDSSVGPAMPPVMERYVVRPTRDTTFEAQMEHFKVLQLGSPQGSRAGRQSLHTGVDNASTASFRVSIAAVAAAAKTSAVEESGTKNTPAEKKEQQSLLENVFQKTTQMQSPNAIALAGTEDRFVVEGRANLSQSSRNFLLSEQEEPSPQVANLSHPSEQFPLSEMKDQSISRDANLSQSSDSQPVVLCLDAETPLDGTQQKDESILDGEEKCQENEELTSKQPPNSPRLPSKSNKSTEKGNLVQADSQAPPTVKVAPSSSADSSESTRSDAKMDRASKRQSNRHPESTATTDLASIPRVTPPYEKPISDVARDCESVPDIKVCIGETMIHENRETTGVSPAQKELQSRSVGSTKPSEHSESAVERRVSTNLAPVASVQAAQNSSQRSQKDANESSPFTYVSTLSPDSRASSSNWTETRTFATKNVAQSYEGHAERKTGVEVGSRASGQKRRPVSEEQPADQQLMKADSCVDASPNSEFPPFGRDGGEVEIVGVRQPQLGPREMGFMPEVVLSDSLRNAMQNFEARPVWQFSNEEAVKPVDKKRRRRPSRKPARERAPFMSPGSNTRSTLQPEAKRKFIDMTDFKTPPLQEPGAHSKRRAAMSKTPPRKPEKDSTKRQELIQAIDPADSWSESKSAARGSTFSRKKRSSSETKPSVSAPP